MDNRVRPVAIAYAHPGTVRAEFADSLFTLLSRYRVQSRICLGSGPRIATTRNNLVRHFLNDTTAPWLWMLDADMQFTPDCLDRLLQAGKHYKVVSGLCFARNDSDTVYPTLYRRDDDGVIQKVPEYPENELIEVDGTGAACLLIHRSVLTEIARKYPEPYVWYEDTAEGGREIGEDITFCLRAKEVGFPVAVHCGVKVGHVKSKVFGENDYRSRS